MSRSGEPGDTGIVLRIPDLGGADGVVVLEVLVRPGDRIEKDTPLLTLESDKATMDVPAQSPGVIERVMLAPGDKVQAGTAIATLRGPAPGEGEPAADETQTRAALRSAEPYGGEPYIDTVPITPMSPPAGTGTASAAAAAAGEPAPGAAGAQRGGRHPYDFDLVVLGAGPGGYTAAFRAADLGLGVALIDRGPTLGGVCLNVGCIPSKALLHAARVIEDARAMAEHGIRFGEPAIDAARLREWKNSVVARLTNGLDALARQRKVTVIRGEASFVSAHEFEVVGDNGARRVSFAQCVIAVGSEPVRLPGMPDDPRVIDSTGALELDLPDSMLVIGGGIIGLEMATVYDALGVRVSVEATTEGLRVSFEGERAPEPQLYGKVLVAVGRIPNGRRIKAEAAGLAVDGRGFIAVDRQMRTGVPHIYAIGDVVGQPMLAHKATHEGKVAAEAAAGLKSYFDARVIPSVAYTDPEIAWVGLTETDAKAQVVAYEKAVFPWSASGRSLALGRDEGLTKLLFDPDSQRVLGAGIVGSSAGDLIAEAALAIEMGADAADLALTIHPHPTLSETVAMAAEAFEGTLTDLYLPKRKGTAQRG